MPPGKERRRSAKRAILVVLAIACASAPQGSASIAGSRSLEPGAGSGVGGEAIVRYEPGASPVERRLARSDAGVERVESLGLPRAELVEVEGSVGAAVRRLERQPGVAFAQPNYRYEALAAAPDDTFYGSLWGHSAAPGFGVNALAAWDRSLGEGVTIAVVDTGVDLTHPDLEENLWSNPDQGETGDGDDNGLTGDVHGYDFVDDDGDPDDFHFHGTHVAGTAAAVAGNELGIAGVAPGAQIMAVRVLDGDGSGSSAAIADGIAYAAEEGARVINLSLGSPAGVGDLLVSAAVDLAAVRGAVVVAAAGNDGADNDAEPTTPCTLPQSNLICVAAVTQSGGLASFSNFGDGTVDVGAPGTSILSAKTDYGAPLLEEGFDNVGLSGWEKDTEAGSVPWGGDASAFSAGTHSATDSPGADYAANSDSQLIRSAPVDLAAERGCRLQFDLRRDIQPPAPSGAFTDRLLAGALAEDGSETIQDTRTFAGSSSGIFQAAEASISDLDGFEAFPAFALFSDATDQREGAHVDRLRLVCRDSEYVDALSPAGNYVSLHGTSMAAPHVSGVAALVLSALPGLSPAQAVDSIEAGVRPLAALQGKTKTGGIVDALGAIEGPVPPEEPEPPLTISVTEAPPPLGRNRRPSIGFAANRLAAFSCSIDGSAMRSCASPFFPSAPLSQGQHGFVVRATDAAGGSAQSDVVSFVIDSLRPRVFLHRRPPKTIRTRHRRAKAVFGFGSNERDVTFICRIDGGLPRFCQRRLARRFPLGKHVVRIRARDVAGNLTRRAAVHRFEVVRGG